MAGRPTKLTPELRQTLVDAVGRGLPLATACALAGVRRETVLEWLARGEGRDPDRRPTTAFAKFAAAIREAQAQDQRRRRDASHKPPRAGPSSLARPRPS